MTKATTTTKPAAHTFTALVGGNLPDGTRFEKGDPLCGGADLIADLAANGVIRLPRAAKKTTAKGDES